MSYTINKEEVMTDFEHAEKMKVVLKELFETIFSDPVVSKKLKKSKLVVKYNITDPEETMWFNCTECAVLFGEGLFKKPTVELTLNWNIFNDFLSQKAKIHQLLARGEIVAKGSVVKVMGLLPIFDNALEQYPKLAKKHKLPI
jgi:alkyl sulfatase BDS1-like metallo-beta-lactamase superfamily hydrolase